MSAFPVTRLRRLRRTVPLRDLVRETRLDIDQFVMPLFVGPQTARNELLPALGRFDVADVVREVEELVRLGVKTVILFGIPDEKDEEGSGAWIDDGIVQRALRELRPRFPELLLLTDVCLCEYTSAFYGPFREAAESAPAFGDRRGYQMDPRNVREALRECELDLAEGADVLMIKPALPCLDVIRAARERFDSPLAAYNVSGEYAMVKDAARAGHLDERAAAVEGLTAIKRAGADLVISYWTK